MTIDVDYSKLHDAIEETIQHLRAGEQDPERARKVSLEVVRDLESRISNGEYQFGIDAAVDAGGRGEFARPMDYVLGGLLSCVQMWCLRWAASKGLRFDCQSAPNNDPLSASKRDPFSGLSR
jgi:hypothetical protein